MSAGQTYVFLGWVGLLALLLFFPVSKLIWVLSVRRLQRRTGRELSPEELQGQLKRARIIAALVVVVFSFLFNANLMGIPRDG
jgi:hypothetical protein